MAVTYSDLYEKLSSLEKENERLREALKGSAAITNLAKQEIERLTKVLEKIAKQEMLGPQETPREEYMHEQFLILVGHAQRALKQVRNRPIGFDEFWNVFSFQNKEYFEVSE